MVAKQRPVGRSRRPVKDARRRRRRGDVMRLTVYVVLLGLLSAANTEAQTQRTDVCVKGIADAYRFRPVPFTQNEIRVTTNRNNPGFFFLVFAPQSRTVGSASSNSRSLHFSTGLLNGRHEVWVGCLRSSSYTIQWVNGNEKRLSPPRYISFLTSANLTAKAPVVATEIRLEQAMQQAAASQLAAEQGRE